MKQLNPEGIDAATLALIASLEGKEPSCDTYRDAAIAATNAAIRNAVTLTFDQTTRVVALGEGLIDLEKTYVIVEVFNE